LDKKGLYAIHISGPDSIFAVASFAIAEQKESELNTVFNDRTESESTPKFEANIVDWPYERESHAEAVLQVDWTTILGANLANMTESKLSWCYSFNNSDFSSGTFSSKGAALADAQKEGGTRNLEGEFLDVIYLAEACLANNEQFFPDADLIIEHMALQADDVGGEHANDYPDIAEEATNELTQQLHALLSKWCQKNEVLPTFYNVRNSEPYDLCTLAKLKSVA